MNFLKQATTKGIIPKAPQLKPNVLSMSYQQKQLFFKNKRVVQKCQCILVIAQTNLTEHPNIRSEIFLRIKQCKFFNVKCMVLKCNPSNYDSCIVFITVSNAFRKITMFLRIKRCILFFYDLEMSTHWSSCTNLDDRFQ